MTRSEVSKLTGIVDARLFPSVEAELSRMGIVKYYTVRAKQVSLVERFYPLVFRQRSRLTDARAEMFRFYVPRALEAAALQRIAAAADLFLPGHGSVFAENVVLLHQGAYPWDERMLETWPEIASPYKSAEYDLIGCILKRGYGDDLARTMLDMGLCVPIVTYGQGVGMRDRLGLLRITIPPEKEILWLVVPSGDSNFVLDTAVRKAGLNEPGRGFLYRTPVRALMVNTRIHRDPRRHVASMEQVITALDQLRGSTDWRRLGAQRQVRDNRRLQRNGAEKLVNFSIISQEGRTASPTRAAMDAGAGGATLVRLLRCGTVAEHAQSDEVVVRAHEACDLIVGRDLAERLAEVVAEHGVFDADGEGFVEISDVTDAITYSGG